MFILKDGMDDSLVRSEVQFRPTDTFDVEKAWYIFSILLRNDQPISLEEACSQCKLFSVTPDIIRCFSSIPRSPLHLRENGTVTVSMVALSAMEDYVSKVTIGCENLRGVGGLEGNRFGVGDVRTYFRKRRRSVLDEVPILATKRRLSLHSTNDERSGDLSFPVTFIEESVCNNNVIVRNISMVDNLSTTKVGIECSNKDEGKELLLLDYAMCPSSCLKLSGPLVAEPVSPKHHGYFKDETNLSDSRPTKVDRVDRGKELLLLDYAMCPSSCLKLSGPLVAEPVSPKHHGYFKDETNLSDSRPTKVDRVSQIQKVKSLNFDLNLDPLPCQTTHPASCEEFAFFTNELRNNEGCNSVYLEMDVQKRGILLEDRICDNCQSKVQDSQSKDVKIMEEVNGKEELEERAAIENEQTQVPSMLLQLSSNQKQPAKSSDKLNDSQSNGLPGTKFSLESLNHSRGRNSQKQHNHEKNVQKLVSKEQKLKNSRKDMFDKEIFFNTASTSPMNDMENKELPHFESFITEEEEGSGGYGTVYRTRRKNDGRMFAIKCPHVNAHRSNVTNELRMLERFGGRNFIIKYEGSFSNGSNECFVLEHVEHDRPEVLKKEIDMYQLQWYGYCLFRALACLHKQGVVHRDVKPGNFLFSRNANQGYLIDFNLAMDLQKKYSIASKSRSNYTPFDRIPLPNFNYDSSTKSKRFVSGISVGINQRAGVKSIQTQEHEKNAKKPVQHNRPPTNYPDHSGTLYRSQGADGSGLTSAKDVTSARTPPIDRMREPLPCHGRKELISLVQNAMRDPSDIAIKSPTSQRKRIAAPPAKTVSKIFYPSPMPLRCTGVPVAGSGSLKSRGDGKHKREGSCAGTKGFRAPEVLIRSLHQGPKIDVWSAGVTLLYLIIGRIPFTGDPEQNIRDIAKLRGSEDLWELAKLHDHESSFPVDLLEIQNLPGLDLESWVKRHTRRPELVKVVPRSLFDLIDKCLTINPRLRISSEEALKHEFLASCHERLRKQKMLQRSTNLDSTTQHL